MHKLFFFKFKKFVSINIFEYIINNICIFINSIKRSEKIKRIHVFGDSHTGSFRYNNKFIVHHLGPVTAYNFGQIISTTNCFKKIIKTLTKLPFKSDLIFIAGEIDCRIHIYNQYMKNNQKYSLEELLIKTIERYCQALTFIKMQGFNVYVCSIPPCNNQLNKYRYPFYGDINVQSYLKCKFNQLLEQYCNKSKIQYIDVYSNVVDQNGFIKTEYTYDDIHLNKKAIIFVEKWF